MAKAKPSSPATEASAPELPRIYTVRKQKVMLDSELAALFGVETKVFNQAIRRNLNKFPSDFAFCLTREELANLRSQIVTSSSSKDAALRSQSVTLEQSQKGKHSKYLPWVFTEHGALMAAMILRSERAVSMSVFVVRAFVQMREQIGANLGVLRRLAEIDKKLLEHDVVLREVVERPSRNLSVVRVAARRSRGIFRWGPRLEILSEYSFARSAPKFARDISPLLRRSTERLRPSPLLNPQPEDDPKKPKIGYHRGNR